MRKGIAGPTSRMPGTAICEPFSVAHKFFPAGPRLAERASVQPSIKWALLALFASVRKRCPHPHEKWQKCPFDGHLHACTLTKSHKADGKMLQSRGSGCSRPWRGAAGAHRPPPQVLPTFPLPLGRQQQQADEVHRSKKITPLRRIERFGQSLAQAKQVFQKSSSFYCSQKLTRLV
jgi:hypothetical protein